MAAGSSGARGVDDVLQQRPAGQRLQDFRQRDFMRLPSPAARITTESGCAAWPGAGVRVCAMCTGSAQVAGGLDSWPAHRDA